MNYVHVTGRIGKTPEVKYTVNNVAVLTFSLAVDRRRKEDGTKEVDWIDCVAWEGTAELIGKYVDKGQRLGVTGHLQKRSWKTQNGEDRVVTEVLVKEVELIDRKEKKEEKKAEPPEPGYFDSGEDICPF